MRRTRNKRKTRHKTRHRKTRKQMRNKRRISRRRVMRGGVDDNIYTKYNNEMKNEKDNILRLNMELEMANQIIVNAEKTGDEQLINEANEHKESLQKELKAANVEFKKLNKIVSAFESINPN